MEQNKTMPEQKLWAAVIMQAIDDLTFYPKTKMTHGRQFLTQKTNSHRIRDDARSFFFNNSPIISRHRKFVFVSAGLDEDIDLSKLRRLSNEIEAQYG